MNDLFVVLKYEMSLLLVAFTLVIFYQIMTERINLSGLLRDKKTHELSPSRIQKLVFVMIVAMYYLFLTYKNPHAFPELPDSLLYILTGSSAGYLIAKLKSMLGFPAKWFK